MTIEDVKKLLEIKEKEERQEDLEKINLIKIILNEKNGFFKINMDLALAILLFLGVDKDNLVNCYKDLINIKNFENEEEINIFKS